MELVIEKNSIKPLNKKRKDLLKNFIGSSSSKIDLNKVKDNWNNEKN
ncbi:hypothetical protein [Rossellomorea vietnamensis]|nr:hypothetical protein [Rossellomorea vietnamensis]